MEPILPTPNRLDVSPSSQEASNFGTETTPNVAPEQPRESIPTSPASQQTVVPAYTAVPVQPVPASPVATPVQSPSGSPQIADDVDVIEKEWVDKAKKIVTATKEDPHLQEKEVSKLQADYLMKRYNKKIKLDE